MNAGRSSRREFIVSTSLAGVWLATTRSIAQFTDPTGLSITEAARLIRSGDLSPVSLVRAYLERIQRLNDRLNAFITVTTEPALAQARQLESELASGMWRGPLHGIPIGLKDNIDTAGILTTAASAVLAGRRPDEDAEVVRRLKEAGAIILGKLNMHEFAFGATSAITNAGPVHNPWDLARVPGGSSGGSGAAVAARLCAGALGTDTGGSVRIPSAHCGIVGLKPTYGLVSTRGVIPLSVSLDHVGPMCRTVGDAALMLQAMAGYDSLDITSIEADLPNFVAAMQSRTSGLRLGVPREPFYDNLDPQIEEAVGSALEVLGGLTTGIDDVELHPRPEVPLVSAEAMAYHAPLIEEKRELYDPNTLTRIMRGVDYPATDYVRGTHQLELARKAIARVFESVDLLVTPTLSRLPIRIDEAQKTPFDDTLSRNTMPFNVYGVPSISLPCGFSSEGLPIGLQISGPALGELDVLALAHAYEQATDWHERVPPLA